MRDGMSKSREYIDVRKTNTVRLGESGTTPILSCKPHDLEVNQAVFLIIN
jgi:hypothetical protein